jgi:putative acetyltransferase
VHPLARRAPIRFCGIMAKTDKAAQNTDAVLRDVVKLFEQAQRSMTSCCSDASARECEAIMLLGSRGVMTVQTFAEAMGLEKTWASRLVARLEENGHLKRSANPEDGRSSLIELSAKGQRELAKLQESVSANAVNLLQCVPAAERGNVERALVHLRDALTACLNQCSPPGRRE